MPIQKKGGDNYLKQKLLILHKSKRIYERKDARILQDLADIPLSVTVDRCF